MNSKIPANIFRQKSKKLTVGGQQIFIIISLTWKKLFPRHKVPLAEKMQFWRPSRSKVRRKSGNFSLKVWKKTWKKIMMKIFSLRKSSGHVEERVSNQYKFFFKSPDNFTQNPNLLMKKNKKTFFFLRNCLGTHKIDYLKSCHFFMEIAQKFTRRLRKTMKITCFLKPCVFPQNFPPDSQNAFLTNLPEKNYQNCENIGLKVQKKLRN